MLSEGFIGIEGFVTLSLATIIVAVFSFYLLPRELEEQGCGQIPRKFGIKGLYTAIHLFLLLLLTFLVHFGLMNYGVVHDVLSGDVSVSELRGYFSESGNESSGNEESRTGIREGGPGSTASVSAGRTPERADIPLIRPISVDTVVTATALFFALFGFGRWRRIEAGLLHQLQNISMVEEDVLELAKTLKRCSFASASLESDAAMALDRIQRRLGPEAANQNADSLASRWAKVDRLLEMWRTESDWSTTLPRSEVPNVDAARSAHQRKSKLAVRVDNRVAQVEKGEADLTALAELTDEIQRGQKMTNPESGTRSCDSRSEQEMVTEGQTLHDLLEPLVEYFIEEYDEMLWDWCKVSAKSVMLSGDEAETRLKILKEEGFSEIGNFEPIELNRAFMMALFVFFGILLVFYGVPKLAAQFSEKVPTPEGGYIFILSFSMTLATVLGAMIGGMRALAKAPVTPWGIYITAGVIIGFAYSLITFTAISLGVEPPSASGSDGDGRPAAFYLIVALIPFTIVLAICHLARKRGSDDLAQRATDGLWMAVFVGAAGVMFIVMADLLDIPPPNEGLTVADRMAIVGVITAVLGLVIGCLVIQHVRKAALSSVVLSSPETKDSTNEESDNSASSVVGVTAGSRSNRRTARTMAVS